MEALLQVTRKGRAALRLPPLIPSGLEKPLEVLTVYASAGRARWVEIAKSVESDLAATLFIVLGEEG